jgi:hypothetical protein
MSTPALIVIVLAAAVAAGVLILFIRALDRDQRESGDGR